MKHLRFSLALVILILFWNVSKPVFAEQQIVFSDINTVVVDLQKYSLAKEELDLLNKTIFSLKEMDNKNNEIIKKQEEEIVLLNQEIDTNKKFNLELSEGVNKLNLLIQEEKKICDIRVSEAKPTFFQKIKNALSYIGIGILIGISSSYK